MNFLKEKGPLIMTVLTVIAVFGFIGFRYLPFNRKIEMINKTKRLKLALLDKTEAEKANIESFRAKRDAIFESVADFDENIPVDRDLGGFLQQIADLMNEFELKEQFVEPGEEVAVEKLISIPINMQCQGSFEQIFSFYKSLRDIKRQIRIEDVKISNDGSYDGTVSMQTKAFIYYRGSNG